MATNADSMLPDGLGIDPGRVSGHHAARLEPSHARLHRRHRQPGRRRQLRQRGPAVGDQLARQAPRSISSSGSLMAALYRSGGHEYGIQTWQLRAQFAAALSRDVRHRGAAPTPHSSRSAAEVNRELGRRRSARLLHGYANGTARSASAPPRELADVADLFAAFGMHPVGFYDLREAPRPSR